MKRKFSSQQFHLCQTSVERKTFRSMGEIPPFTKTILQHNGWVMHVAKSFRSVYNYLNKSY